MSTNEPVPASHAVGSSRRLDEGERRHESHLRRGQRIAVRVVGVLGLLAFNFMLVVVISDAAGRIGEQQVLEQPGSAQARIGAEHPGEAVHLTGAVAAAVMGVSGLAGLVVRPDRAGSAAHVGAGAIAWLLAAGIAGNPDNHGGQAGLVDPAFVVLPLPALVAAMLAAPWRARRSGGVFRPGFLLLAGLGLPWVWYGIQQGLMQRYTWPPMADPHHQAHWFALSLLAFMVLLVGAVGALSGRGWRVATVTAGSAATALAAASLVAPEAASALHPLWATAAALWGLSMLGLTWYESVARQNKGGNLLRAG